jgi:DNA processing protein
MDTLFLNPEQPTGELLNAWLHLANVPMSSRLLTALLTAFDFDPRRVLAASDAELDDIPRLTRSAATRLRDPIYRVTEKQKEWFAAHNVRLLRINQPEYPEALREIPDAPALLFFRGTLHRSDALSVGMVGSRTATPYGKGMADRFARELTAQNMTVVSGGAAGIDTSAHQGALAAGGRTIAVIGCGLDIVYPRQNEALFEKIVQNGAILSEYPLGAQPEAWRFPGRNRIISGLSEGVLVVEASKTSGALITARYAAEQGRPVMAIPGGIDRPSSSGCNQLIKEGAAMVTELEDILRELNLLSLPAKPPKQFPLPIEADVPEETAPPPAAASQAKLATLTDEQKTIVACLSLTPVHLDQIVRTTSMQVAVVGRELTMLELFGVVHRLPGNAYILMP